MFERYEFLEKEQKQKEHYADLEIEIRYFEESVVRTSFGDDGNEDDWGDENANPIGIF